MAFSHSKSLEILQLGNPFTSSPENVERAMEDSTVPSLSLISTQSFKAGHQGLWDSFTPFLSKFEHNFSRDCRQAAGESSKRASALSSYRNLWIMCSYLPGCSAAPGFRKIWKISGCLAFQVACEFLEAHLPCIESSECTSIISGQNGQLVGMLETP